jgi:glycosyltransferase involved in cell wall biosynthesis
VQTPHVNQQNVNHRRPSAPDVTVVIPTLNRWPLLSAHALPSALAQQDVEFEVVVIDDGSTDETPARLADLNEPRLRVLRHETRRGLASARNTAIAAARGEWVAFLDDDDLWSPRKLRGQLDSAAREAADWVYAGAVAVDERKNVVEADPLPEPSEVFSLLLTGNFVPGGGSDVIARTELVRRVGGFDEELFFFEDWDLWLRLAAVGRAAACAEVLVARLVHSQSMLFRDKRNVLEDFERLLGKHRRVTRDDKLGLSQWVAYEHHRAGYRRQAAWQYLRTAITYRSPGNLPPALGALFGERGMGLARRLVAAMGGHAATEENGSLPARPAWLDSLYGAVAGGGSRSQGAAS